MIRPYRGCPVDLLPVAPATSGPVCHLVQQQIAPFSITGTRPSSMSSGCTRPALGGSGSLCLPTGSHLGQSGGEVSGIPGQENYSNCSRVAQDALVLGPSGHVKPEPFMPAQPVDSTIQSDPSQESSLRHHSGRTHLHMFPHDWLLLRNYKAQRHAVFFQGMQMFVRLFARAITSEVRPPKVWKFQHFITVFSMTIGGILSYLAYMY